MFVQSRSKLTLLIYFSVVSSTKGVNINSEKEYEEMNVISIQCLNRFVDSLEKIINFCSRHKHYVDLNFKFGLFLVNVNLRPTLKLIHGQISTKLYNRLEKILRKNDILMKYFQKMLENSELLQRKRNDLKIVSLFENETLWMENLPTLSEELLSPMKLKFLWNNTNIRLYYSKVFNFEKGNPSPTLSDRCMMLLGENPVYERDASARCRLEPRCLNMLAHGSDYGYHISHRLLLLLGARLGRQCHILSEEDDAIGLRRLCHNIFSETEFISRNNYVIIDLFLEQIALCSLAGHAAFLRCSWINDTLRYQTNLGCFSQSIPEHIYKVPTGPKTWKLARENNEILRGNCNTHVTAVAAATLAPAIRYILEMYHISQ